MFLEAQPVEPARGVLPAARAVARAVARVAVLEGLAVDWLHRLHQHLKHLLTSSAWDYVLLLLVLVVFFQLQLQPLYEPLQPLFQLQLQLLWLQLSWM